MPNNPSAQGWVVCGSLAMMASPVGCIASQQSASVNGVGVGALLFLVGLVLFVIGRLQQH